VSHEIKLIDALKGLAELEDKSVDLVVTDPAYASLEKWRNMGTTTRLKNSKQSSNAWFPTLQNEYFEPFFEECYRVMKRGSDIYVMCDEETAEAIKPLMRKAGYEVRKSLIWWKVGKRVEIPCENCGHVLTHTNTPGTPGMGYPFRSQWEMILVGRKGKRKAPKNRSVRNVQPTPIDDDESGGVLQVPWIKRKNAYPTEKPVELLELLIQQSSEEGELVLDPFAGSGSCGEAAFNLGRNFLGFDVEQKAFDYFQKRKAHWVRDGEVAEDASEPEGGIFDLL